MPTEAAEELLTSPGSAVGDRGVYGTRAGPGRKLDARTDLFSFGVVLYEMVTGILPFRGGTSGIITEAILNRAPVAAVRLNPDIPAELERIINRALEKDRNLRYQHAADIRAELQRLRQDTTSSRAVVAAEGEGVRSAPAPGMPSSGTQRAASSASQPAVTEQPRNLRWKLLVPLRS